jgi:8-hydroxy-5-deazaflavin:NADPH oxidoreductase
MTRIAFIGAGPVAQQLATLARAAGHTAVVSSRTPPNHPGAVTFSDAAQQGEIAVIAIPFRVAADVLPDIASALDNKIVVDATNPLNADYTPIILGPETSAGEQIAALLPTSRIVKAFNSIFADVMAADRQQRSGLTATAFVAGDDPSARGTVSDLAREFGFSPVQTGPLHTARYLEALAHLNIQIAFREGGGPNAALLYHQAIS